MTGSRNAAPQNDSFFPLSFRAFTPVTLSLYCHSERSEESFLQSPSRFVTLSPLCHSERSEESSLPSPVIPRPLCHSERSEESFLPSLQSPAKRVCLGKGRKRQGIWSRAVGAGGMDLASSDAVCISPQNKVKTGKNNPLQFPHGGCKMMQNSHKL